MTAIVVSICKEILSPGLKTVKHVLLLTTCILIAEFAAGQSDALQAAGQSNALQPAGVSVQHTHWGYSEEKEIFLYTLQNKNGMTVQVSNFGGTIVSVIAPDKNGQYENLVLGFDSLSQYLGRNPLFGSLVGRYANRIAGDGRFMLDGKEYQLESVNNGVHMHGGARGFNRQVFDAVDEFATGDSAGVSIFYLSRDGEGGYPGNLRLTVTYTLTNDNALKIRYDALTDQTTILNLTNHSYFNLTACKDNVLGHQVKLFADAYTVMDERLIPTGEIRPVIGTAYDFTSTHTIGEKIQDIPGGYDMNYVLRKPEAGLSLAAEIYEPGSGRFMQAYTTEPGMQFYTSNSFNGSIMGRDGIAYPQYAGFCLEMQHFPDSPHHPEFPSVVLRPGETYHQLTVYRFSVK